MLSHLNELYTEHNEESMSIHIKVPIIDNTQ